jgi:hypothetical protein
MKSETRRQNIQTTPACWQREAPCPCVRIETSPQSSHVFPYQHFVCASLDHVDEVEQLQLRFSSHDVELRGRNLRNLLLALQDFAVKWIRVMPLRYQELEPGDAGIITDIQIGETK